MLLFRLPSPNLIRERIKSGFLKVAHIPGHLNIADILNKRWKMLSTVDIHDIIVARPSMPALVPSSTPTPSTTELSLSQCPAHCGL